TDSKSRPREPPDRGLGPRARGLGPVPSRSADPDVDGVDPLLLRGVRDLLRGLHRRVRGGLVLRGLHDHPAGRLRDGLRTREVRERDDDVVIRRVDVRDPPFRHGAPPPGAGASGPCGAGGWGPASPSAAGSGGGAPGRAGCMSLLIGDRGSYTIPPSSVRVTRYPGTVTRRGPIGTCPWTMNCRAWCGVNARPLTNARVWSRRERTASTSRPRTSSRVAPSVGRRPSRPRR